jgi:hypothetical protein
MNTKRLLVSALIGLTLIIALVAIDTWLFRTVLSLDYLPWYLHSGTFISLGFAFVTLAWSDLNKIKGLVSAHPFLYISACLYLIGLPIYVFGSIMRRPQQPLTPRAETRSALAPWSAVWRAAQALMDFFDALITIVFAGLFTLVALAWLICVAPVQYFVYLICAAPARLMRRSRRRVISNFDEAQYFHLDEVPAEGKVPAGWLEAGFFTRPVSMTAAFAAALLWILAQVIR